MDAGGGFQYISLFSVKKCNYRKKNVEKAQKSPWIPEVVSNTYAFFQSKSVIIQIKTSEKLKSPHGYRRRFPLHIPVFSQKV